jgi:pimeloyl-ACP methyl ester carboxylesterase
MQTSLWEVKGPDGVLLRGLCTTPTHASASCLVCVHGFERAATTEPKFKELIAPLLKKGVSVIRIDLEGCGISDGSFDGMTVARLAEGLAFMMRRVQQTFASFSFIAHSLGGAVVTRYLTTHAEQKPEHVFLLAPALNQRQLLRWYFAQQVASLSRPPLHLTWDQLSSAVNEEQFAQDCQKPFHETKSHLLRPGYFLENQEKDYSFDLASLSLPHCVLIQGDKDKKVPLESQTMTFSETILVRDGDHDMEKPAQREQWLPRVVAYL